ncbi:MAG: hypothetical protein K2X66_16685, partial [Cyanobacteria bacterium]|nr:hypothetical protein [Cyanobacteriota bacterium]
DLRALKEEFEALIKLDEGVLNAIGFEEVEIEDLLKIPLLPDLNQELTESLKNGKTMTCPHCGGSVDV